MPTCIKSLFLAAIVAELKTLTVFKDVVLNPVDLPEEASRHPFCAVVDMPERSRKDNRMKRADFTLRIVVWTMSEHEGDVSPDLDEIHAQIHQLLVNSTTIHQYGTLMEEADAEKLFYSELESGLINQYNAQYAHAWGNPYLLNPERK
jgi:hypothetical protein